MVRSLLSLYVRVGASAANLVLRVAARSVDLASEAVRMAVPSSGEPVRSESAAESVPSESAGEPVRSESAAEPVRIESAEEPARSEAEELLQRPAEPAPGPPLEVDHDRVAPQPLDETEERAKTIDDEPELVAEVAEPGAEDGASAEVEVDEPWDGYEDQTADEVIARIGEADAAVLAVLELYERSHKDRRTVLTAAERRQKELANAPS